jgi:hypothetical protein
MEKSRRREGCNRLRLEAYKYGQLSSKQFRRQGGDVFLPLHLSGGRIMRCENSEDSEDSERMWWGHLGPDCAAGTSKVASQYQYHLRRQDS